MTTSLVDRVQRHLRPERAWIWIVITLFIKVLVFLLVFYKTPGPGGNYIWSYSDTESYFLPIESLISGNGYQPDYRLPGYGIVYLFARSVFEPSAALLAVVALQWTLAVLSVFCLAKSILNFTSNRIYFYIVFFLFAFSSYTNILDSHLLSESLTTSALIFSVYFLSEYKTSRRAGHLLVSGVFLCWACFLRPVLFPIAIIPSLYLIGESIREKAQWRLIFVRFAFFIAPLCVGEGMWLVRNYNVYHRFIPLSKTVYMDDIEQSYRKELMEFVISWGGDRSWWNPLAEIRWFTGNRDGLGVYDQDLPPYIYTSSFNRDSLVAIRNSISAIEDPATDPVQQATLIASTKKSLSAYTRSIKEEKPMLFIVWSRIMLLKKFFFHSGTHLLFRAKFQDLTTRGKLLKIFYSALYWVVIGGGCIGIVMIVVTHQIAPPTKLLITGLTLYFVLIFPLIGHIEYRYFVPGYPFMLVCASFPLTQIVASLTRNEKDIGRPSNI